MRNLVLVVLLLAISGAHSTVLTQNSWFVQAIDPSGATVLPDGTATYKVDVTLPIPWTTVPQVALALDEFDASPNNFGISVFAQNINETYFQVLISIQKDCKANTVGVQWFATIDNRIAISYVKKDASDDSRLAEQATVNALRTFSTRVDHPQEFNKPGAVIFTAGFRFGSKGHPALHAEAQHIDKYGFNLVYSTWGDSQFYGASFYAIHFEKGDKFFVDYAETPKGDDSPLYNVNGQGVRYVLIDKVLGDDTLGTFAGFTHFEFSGGYYYRIALDYRRNDLDIEAKFLTWADTQIFSASANVFVSPVTDNDPNVVVAKTYTQTGWVSKDFASSNHPFAVDASQDRFVIYKASYPQAFKIAPKIMTGIIGFDVGAESPGFQIEVVNVSPFAFSFSITVKAGSLLKSFSMGWLATISPNLYPTSFSKSYSPSDLAGALKDGVSSFQYSILHPVSLNSPAVAIAINGFQFVGKSDVCLDAVASNVDVDGLTLTTQTWKDAKLSYLSLNIMHFESSAKRTATEAAVGEMVDGTTQKGRATVYPNAEFFVSVSHLDFENKGDVELAQDFFIKDQSFTTLFSVGDETHARGVKDTILVVPHSKTDVRMVSQTGKTVKIYTKTGHAFETDDKTDRKDSITVNFPEKFDVVPQVAVGLSGFEISGDGTGIMTEISEITRTQFTLTVTCPAGSLCQQFQANWLANVNDEVAMNVVTFDKNSAEFQKFFSNSGNRYTNLTVVPSATFENPGAIVVINGFKFKKGSPAIFYSWVRNADPSGAYLVYGTFGNTQPEYISLTIIQYEIGRKHGGVNVESVYASNLWWDSGDRSEKIVTRARGDGLYFYGISGMDFAQGVPMRLDQQIEVDYQNATITAHTWGDSQVAKVTDGVFFTVYAD